MWDQMHGLTTCFILFGHVGKQDRETKAGGVQSWWWIWNLQKPSVRRAVSFLEPEGLRNMRIITWKTYKVKEPVQGGYSTTWTEQTAVSEGS